MSTRIKSAAVAIVIAVILLIAHGTFLFNIAVGAISALAIYEIFRATKMTEHKYQTIACCAFAFVDAFMPVFYRHGWLYFFSYKLYMGLFVIAMCLLYLKEHTKFQYTEFFFMLGVGILLPYSFLPHMILCCSLLLFCFPCLPPCYHSLSGYNTFAFCLLLIVPFRDTIHLLFVCFLSDFSGFCNHRQKFCGCLLFCHFSE